MARPSVSLIVPFAGSPAQLRALLERLRAVSLRPGDEVIVADNSPIPVRTAGEGIHIVEAAGSATPGFARNRAARIAHGDWLVFVDADTEPSASLLDDYFEPPPGDGAGILAGGIVDVAPVPTLAARYSVARAQLSQLVTLDRAGEPYAQTANCAVRRSAFERVGGFDESARAGEDADLCFRLARAGWAIEPRPHAEVGHRGRTTTPALLVQLQRHGAGAAWLNRRYPGSFAPPRPLPFARRLGRAAGTALVAATHRDREAAAFALLDLAGACAFESGRLRSNLPRRSWPSHELPREPRSPARHRSPGT